MRVLSSIVVGALALSGFFLSADAQACGGCFHIQQSESGQVTGHRMIFSVSNEQTTLWDQIEYQGSPESFAWVLPIHGEVQVGLSSDALFNVLDQSTRLQVFSPDINCGPSTCDDRFGGSGGGGGAGGGGGGVTVIAQATVGPFETVQLASSDPAALQTWLADHGYVIPADVVPIIDAYVNEGFDFLAMRLQPGESVSSMQPVRVTSPGAGLGLPLRMVAAGTGAITPITLWIVGEGRYEPANFPSFEIDPNDLVWNWDTQKSNYAELKMAGFADSQNTGWLTEAAITTGPWLIQDPLQYTAEYDTANSGYGDTAEEALTALGEDLDALYGTVDPNNFKITRIHGQLSKAALATDLVLGASANQKDVYPTYYVENTVGTPPECPPPPDCNEGGNGSGGSGSGNNGVGLWTPGGNGSGGDEGGAGSGANNDDGGNGSSSGCAAAGDRSGSNGAADAGTFGAMLGMASLAAAWRRRRQRNAGR